jgi:hypothetical protein
MAIASPPIKAGRVRLRDSHRNMLATRDQIEVARNDENSRRVALQLPTFFLRYAGYADTTISLPLFLYARKGNNLFLNVAKRFLDE